MKKNMLEPNGKLNQTQGIPIHSVSGLTDFKIHNRESLQITNVHLTSVRQHATAVNMSHTSC